MQQIVFLTQARRRLCASVFTSHRKNSDAVRPSLARYSWCICARICGLPGGPSCELFSRPTCKLPKPVMTMPGALIRAQDNADFELRRAISPSESARILHPFHLAALAFLKHFPRHPICQACPLRKSHRGRMSPRGTSGSKSINKHYQARAAVRCRQRVRWNRSGDDPTRVISSFYLAASTA